jgi:hypothetical protein
VPRSFHHRAAWRLAPHFILYCLVYGCDYRRASDWYLDLLNSCRSYLQVTVALSLIHSRCRSLQHVLSLLSLLCHQPLLGGGSQQCPLLPCSRSYRVATVSQLTHCFSCPAYNISAQTAQNTSFLCCCLQFLRSHYLVRALVFLLISRSFHSNRSTCHIFLLWTKPGPYHSSGGWALAFNRVASGSFPDDFLWKLCWAKWGRSRFLSKFFLIFSPTNRHSTITPYSTIITPRGMR